LLKNGVSDRDPALRGTFAIAHILISMLRIPKGRAPWLTARHLFFKNLHGIYEEFPSAPLNPEP
jgi:hypothetical protein